MLTNDQRIFYSIFFGLKRDKNTTSNNSLFNNINNNINNNNDQSSAPTPY